MVLEEVPRCSVWLSQNATNIRYLFNISKVLTREGQVSSKCSDQELKQLKEVGVLPFKTTVANLIDQVGMETLVKVIDTPEAWAVYKTLWNGRPMRFILPTTPSELATLGA